MTKGLEIIGFVLLLGGILWGSYSAIRYAHRSTQIWARTDRGVSILRCVLVIVSATAAVILASIRWSVSPAEAAIGFPIPWLIWDATNIYWQDSDSSISLIPWVIDLIVGFTLPHLMMATVSIVKKRNVASHHGAT